MPQVSKIAKLPQELRQWLHSAFVERGFGDIEALTEELNQALRDAGLDITIGKSAVGAESLKVKRAQKAIRDATEAARLLASASPDDADLRSAASMALVQADMFDTLVAIREAEDQEDPVARLGVLGEAALSLSRLSRARVNQARWQAEVDAKARAAAEKVDRLAKKGGLSAEAREEILSTILGIAKRPAAEAQGATQGTT